METKSLLSKDNGTSLSKKIHGVKIEKEINGISKRSQRKPINFKTNKGYSSAASIKLLLKKLNITAHELDTLRNNSLAFTKASAKKFEKQSRETKIDVKALLANAALVNYESMNSILQPYSLPIPLDIPPSPIVDTFINPDVTLKHGHIHAEGDGDGLITQAWGGNADQYDSFRANWKFNFTPPASAFYSFSSSIIAAGSYYLIADDGWPESKEASCSVNLQSWVYQELPRGAFIPPNTYLSQILVYGPDSDIFTDGDDNINRFSSVIVTGKIDFKALFLFANIPVEISIDVNCQVMGKGEGSIADMNFSQENGAICCPGLSVKSS
jgi:hypothetical protein